MGLNLEKGQRADITKNTGITVLNIGLGWDAAAPGGAAIDLDAMVFLLNKDGKCATDDFVFYGMQKKDGKLMHKSGSVVHSGDNLTGAGEGDDELISVELPKVPPEVEKMVFAIAIYKASERKQNFGMVKNAFARVVDASTNKEILKYDLTEDYSINTSVIVGEIYRKDGEWKFNAVGTGSKEEIAGLARTYGCM